MNFFQNNDNEHVGGHDAPDLPLDRVVALTQKLLDTQVQFDTFEEKFHLVAAFVQSGKGQDWQGGVNGQEDQSLLGYWVLDPNSAQVFGVILGNLVTIQSDGLIADKTAARFHLGRVNAPCVKFAFGAGHK